MFHLERLSNDNTVDCTIPMGNLYWFSIRSNKGMGKQHTDEITAGQFLGFTRSKNNNPRIKSQGTALLLWYGSVIFNSSWIRITKDVTLQSVHWSMEYKS